MKTSEEIIKIIQQELKYMENNPTSFTWGEYHTLARVYSKIVGSEFSSYLKIFEEDLSVGFKRCM